MIDGECSYLEPVLFEHCRGTAGAWRRAGRSVDFHGERLHLPVRGRQQRGAVMRDAIAFIQRVGLGESVHHLIDARWPVDAQRMVAPIRPRLEVDFAEIADVIGMKVGEHNRGEALARECATVRGSSTRRARYPPGRCCRRRRSPCTQPRDRDRAVDCRCRTTELAENPVRADRCESRSECARSLGGRLRPVPRVCESSTSR